MNKVCFILFGLFLSSCGFVSDEYVLDLSTSTSFTLSSKDEKFPSSFRFHAKGYSSAGGVLELLLDGVVYKSQRITEKVEFEWGGDWYHPDMEFIYRLEKKGNGTLKIKYKIS